MKRAVVFAFSALITTACARTNSIPPSPVTASYQTGALRAANKLQINFVPSPNITSRTIAVGPDGAVYQNGFWLVRYLNGKWSVMPPSTDPLCNATPPPGDLWCPFGPGGPGIAVSPQGVPYWEYDYQNQISFQTIGEFQQGDNGIGPSVAQPSTAKVVPISTNIISAFDMAFDVRQRLWITGYDSGFCSDVGIVSPSTQIMTYKEVDCIQANVNMFAWGPQSAMWAVGNSFRYKRPAVLKFNDDGTIGQTFPIDSRDLEGIAAGSDGALWFTDRTNNVIGRLTVSGQVNTYAIPTTKAGLSRIVAASDGALWFTETYVKQIGKITTAGQITEYSLPSDVRKPYGIAQAPNCTHCPIWFSYSGGLGWVQP